MTDEEKKVVQETVDILDGCIHEFKEAGFEERPTEPDQAPIVGYHLGDIIENRDKLKQLLTP